MKENTVFKKITMMLCMLALLCTSCAGFYPDPKECHNCICKGTYYYNEQGEWTKYIYTCE